jgi:hypothetical protein
MYLDDPSLVQRPARIFHSAPTPTPNTTTSKPLHLCASVPPSVDSSSVGNAVSATPQRTLRISTATVSHSLRTSLRRARRSATATSPRALPPRWSGTSRCAPAERACASRCTKPSRRPRCIASWWCCSASATPTKTTAWPTWWATTSHTRHSSSSWRWQAVRRPQTSTHPNELSLSGIFTALLWPEVPSFLSPASTPAPTGLTPLTQTRCRVDVQTPHWTWR